jgi:hypothetical protein
LLCRLYDGFRLVESGVGGGDALRVSGNPGLRVGDSRFRVLQVDQSLEVRGHHRINSEFTIQNSQLRIHNSEFTLPNEL